MARHRGLSPEDKFLLDPSRLLRLREGVYDLSFLLNRGYSQKSALKLVGDRYQLSSRERLALVHGAWCSDIKRRKPLSEKEIRGKNICIDGFNLLILLETALSGGILIRGKDGLLRDVANIHNSYRIRVETEYAITLSARSIKELGIKEAHWLFDKPISNSGRVSQMVKETGAKEGVNMSSEAVDGVDGLLKRCNYPIFSADSPILDSGVEWFDLEGYIIKHYISSAKIVDLG